VLVDEHDVGGSVLERARGTDSSEAAAEHEDSRALHGVAAGHYWAHEG
jgi:hypothetical protein